VSFPRLAGGKGRLGNTTRAPHETAFSSAGRGERPAQAFRNLDRQGEKAIASFAAKSMTSYSIVEQVGNPVTVHETSRFLRQAEGKGHRKRTPSPTIDRILRCFKANSRQNSSETLDFNENGRFVRVF